MTHKETRSISDFVADTARRKQRAAQSRFAGTPAGSESPREVYLCACAAIAAAFESTGYKYAKSGPHFRRRSGDFTFQVSFQSSHHNVSGEHVCLWIHGTVLSRRLKQWREQQPVAVSIDYVAGGQIGNLQTEYAWLEWELADPNSRDSVIDDAIRAINQLALPYFALFEDVPTLVFRLVEGDLPSMTIDRVIEFLMCYSDQPTARMAAANFLKGRADLVRAYKRDYERYAERGLDWSPPSGYAKQLAYASHAFHFGDLTEKAS